MLPDCLCPHVCGNYPGIKMLFYCCVCMTANDETTMNVQCPAIPLPALQFWFHCSLTIN